MDATKISEENRIYECRAGSHAYGLSTPESDIDTRGIFIQPKDIVLNPFQNIEQCNDATQDRQLMALDKFMVLASKCNPNIIELLFVDQSDILLKHTVMDMLIKNRDLLVTSQARHTFGGYAVSQLKRIKGHNKHLENPQPEEHPSIVDYLKWITPDGKVVSIKQHTTFKDDIKKFIGVKVNNHLYTVYKTGLHLDDTNMIRPLISDTDKHNLHPIDTKHAWDFFNENKGLFYYMGCITFALEEYEHDTTLWENYWSWKNNRNAKRSKLEEEFGYDTKHAMHLMRLLTMGKEILEGKGVIVKRTYDRDALMDIRGGKTSYEELIKQSDEMLEYITNMKTDLPRSADTAKLAKIYTEMVEVYWLSRGWKMDSTFDSMIARAKFILFG